jgi:hypothetical protein
MAVRKSITVALMLECFKVVVCSAGSNVYVRVTPWLKLGKLGRVEILY